MSKKNSMYSAFNTENSSITEKVASKDTECKLKTALSNYSDSTLEKIAYMHIDNPTIEKVEDFVREYMLNELSFFPKQLEVNVEILPSKFNNERSELIDDATGVASISVGGKNVEFPFMISKGEMLPLDIIQMDGQRVPFSRSNMIRIINSMDKLSRQKPTGSKGKTDDSPFVGLTERTSPAMVNGFLGDVLAIRDTNSSIRSRSGGHWITAAGYDYGLEKLAKISGEDTLIGMFYKGKTRKDLEKDSKKAKGEEKTAGLGYSIGSEVKTPGSICTKKKLRMNDPLHMSAINDLSEGLGNGTYSVSQDKSGLVHLNTVNGQLPTKPTLKNTLFHPRKTQEGYKIKGYITKSSSEIIYTPIEKIAGEDLPLSKKAKEEEKKATESLTLAEKVASRLSPARGKVASIQYADDMPLSEKIANYNALAQMNKVNRNHNKGFGCYGEEDAEVKKDNIPENGKENIEEEKESMDPLAQMNKVNANHNNYFGVTASEIHTDLDAILEKVANLAPLSDAALESITYVLKKKAFEQAEQYFEKFATPIEGEYLDRQEAERMENYYNLKWKDANSVPHGTFIIFPELKDDEISVTPGLVLDKFFEFKNGQYSKRKCVISHDRRLKILENNEPFMCIEAPSKAFKLKTVPIASLTENEYFLAFYGNAVVPPSKVLSVRNITGTTSPDGSISQTKAKDNDITGKLFTFKILTEDSMSPYMDKVIDPMKKDQYNRGRYDVCTLIGKKFDYLKPTEFIAAKAKETQTEENTISSIYNSYGFSWHKPEDILSTDENTPVVRIAGPINTYIKSQQQFETMVNMRDVGYDLGEMQEKAAFQVNTINIQCTDRRTGTYNVHVDYKDTTQRLMNFRSQDFNSISEAKLRAILRVCKFTGPKIGEIVYKANNEPYANYPLPPECSLDDINKLAGGAITNVSKESLKKAINKYVNPLEIGKTLAAGVIADLAVNSVKEVVTSPKFMNYGGKVFDVINKLSSDAKSLSSEFEKYAATHEDYELLDIAKTFAISANFMDKVATVLTDKENVYPDIHTVAGEIISAKPVLEKFAYDLTGLKINERQRDMENFNFSTLSNAVRHLDDFYKVACCVYFSTNPDQLNLKG